MENREMNPIIEVLLGNTTLPDREDEILRKILSDNLVGIRTQDLMIQHFAIAAIRGMRESERLALIKRIGCGPRPANHVANWEVEAGLHSGRPQIKGTCGRCGQSCVYTGTPDGASTITWGHCSVGPSKIPEAVIEQYRSRFGFTA
jgi:hypothetical protein